MRRFLFLVLSIPLLTIASIAQTPSPSAAITPSPSITQAASLPSPSPTAESKGIPSLPWVVEMFASAVMLGSVIGVLWLVIRTYKNTGFSIGPRHIQFVSVCLIVPTILVLGLEKVLTSETTATLIGGLAGYLLSNLGKYEPPEPDTGQGRNDKRNKSGGPGGRDQREDSSVVEPTEQVPDDPEEIEIEIKQAKSQIEKKEDERKLVEDRLGRLREHRPRDPFGGSQIRKAAEQAMNESGIGGAISAVTPVQDRNAEWWVDFTEADRITVRYHAGDTIKSLTEKISP